MKATFKRQTETHVFLEKTSGTVIGIEKQQLAEKDVQFFKRSDGSARNQMDDPHSLACLPAADPG
jgi:hypothetical protein